MRTWTPLLITIFLVGGSARADEPELEAAHAQLTDMDRAEQEAFVGGNCEELLELLADDISFYATGRKMTKQGPRAGRWFTSNRQSPTSSRLGSVSPNQGGTL